MEIINVEQKSKEWHNLRKCKLTASHAQAIATGGIGLNTYIHELMAGFYSNGERESFSNKDIERGNELEPLARSIYELNTGNIVQEVGFVNIDEYVGFSPDGFVGDDGIIEIKCLGDKGHFSLLLYGEKGIDSKYQYQMQFELLYSKRKYCDFISYNPNFKESIIIYKIYPDLEMHKKILIGVEIGKQKIIEIKNKLK